MKIIYYSDGNNEICYDIDYWHQHLEDEEINSMELIEMKEDKKNHMRFCSYYSEFLDGDECGKHCAAYEPQNGVKGKCRYKAYTLTETENKITITTNTDFGKENR